MNVNAGVLDNNYDIEVLGQVNVEDIEDVGIEEYTLDLLSVRLGATIVGLIAR